MREVRAVRTGVSRRPEASARVVECSCLVQQYQPSVRHETAIRSIVKSNTITRIEFRMRGTDPLKPNALGKLQYECLVILS